MGGWLGGWLDWWVDGWMGGWLYLNKASITNERHVWQHVNSCHYYIRDFSYPAHLVKLLYQLPRLGDPIIWNWIFQFQCNHDSVLSVESI